MDGMAKPVCGGGEEAGEYDVGLHTVGLCEYSGYYTNPSCIRNTNTFL